MKAGCQVAYRPNKGIATWDLDVNASGINMAIECKILVPERKLGSRQESQFKSKCRDTLVLDPLMPSGMLTFHGETHWNSENLPLNKISRACAEVISTTVKKGIYSGDFSFDDVRIRWRFQPLSSMNSAAKRIKSFTTKGFVTDGWQGIARVIETRISNYKKRIPVGKHFVLAYGDTRVESPTLLDALTAFYGPSCGDESTYPARFYRKEHEGLFGTIDPYLAGILWCQHPGIGGWLDPGLVLLINPFSELSAMMSIWEDEPWLSNVIQVTKVSCSSFFLSDGRKIDG